MRHWFFALCVVAVPAWLGCTKSSPAPTTGSQPAPTAANTAVAKPAPQPIAVPASATPEQVMAVFLQAWQKGDSATFDSLLTTKAREELAKHNVTPDPLSSPNAIFKVEPARLLAGDPTVVNVNSVWTEHVQNEQNQLVEERYEIVWALRQQANGWRVAGMQMELIPGQLQHISFEDPAKMLQMMEAASAAAQQAAGQQPATQPGTVAQPTQSGQPAAQTAQQSPQIPAGQQVPPRIER